MVDVVGEYSPRGRCGTHLVVDVVGEFLGLGAPPVQYDVASVRDDDHVSAHVEPRVVHTDPCQIHVTCRRLKHQCTNVKCRNRFSHII